MLKGFCSVTSASAMNKLSRFDRFIYSSPGLCDNRGVAMSFTQRWASILVFVLSGPGAALGSDCGSSEAFAESQWEKYMEMAVALGCASSVSDSKTQTVAQCNGDSLTKARINAALVREFNKNKYWQNLFNHPNRLTVAPRAGSVTGTLGKTWFFPELYDLSDVDLRFLKAGGSNRVRIQLCSHTPDGLSSILSEDFVAGSSASGTAISKTVIGTLNSFISVTVDGRAPPPFFPITRYNLHIKRPGQGTLRPRTATGPRNTSGFADLHVHMMSFFGFAGGFVHPSPFTRPMNDCDGNHGIVRGVLRGGHAFWDAHPNRTRARLDWPHHLDTAHQQAAAAHLRKAHENGLSLIVMNAVNNEWAARALIKDSIKNDDIPRNDMDSVRLQLRAAWAFAEEHDWFRIARDPWEARRIIADGDLAVILGVEISNLFPDNQGEWPEQLDEFYDLGVRQMGLTHETDTQFAGTARHHGLTLRVANYLKARGLILDNPLGWTNLDAHISAAAAFQFNSPNVVGLRSKGRDLLSALAQRRMLIDIDHMSRLARAQSIEYAKDVLNHYPLIFTHTRFDPLMPSKRTVEALAGFGTSEKEARAHSGWGGKGSGEYMATNTEILSIMELGGIVGLRTGPNHILSERPTRLGGIFNSCPTSSRSFAQMVQFGARRLGVAQSFGTDIAAPFVPQLGPRFQLTTMQNATRACSGFSNTTFGGSAPPVRVPPLTILPADELRLARLREQFDIEGMKHIGMLPALLADLTELQANTASLRRSTENLLRTWERAWDDNRQPLDLVDYWEMMGLAPPDTFVSTLPARSWQTNFMTGASFGPWATVLSGVIPNNSLKFADFNGDGLADAFRRTPAGDWRLNFLNDGAFGDWLEAGSAPRTVFEDMHFFDFNGDGRTDVLKLQNGNFKVRFMQPGGLILPGQSDPQPPSFSGWTDVGSAEGASIARMKFGDFNGDGRADILLAPPAGQFKIKFITSVNGAQFSFGPWVEAGPKEGGTANTIRIGDFNGDERADLFWRSANGTWRIKYGSGTTFSAWSNVGSAGGTPLNDMRFANFNGDGRTDVFRRLSNGAWQINFMGNNGFGPWVSVGSASTPLGNIQFTDFNEDNIADAIRIR